MKQHGFEVEQHRFDCHPREPRACARVAVGVALALAAVLGMAGGSGASLLQSGTEAPHRGDVESAQTKDGCVHSAEDGEPASGHHGQPCDDPAPAPDVGPDVVPTPTPPPPAPPPVTVSPPPPVATPPRPPVAVPPQPTPVPPVATTPTSPGTVTSSERPTVTAVAAGASVRRSGAPENAAETVPETGSETASETAAPARHGQFEFLRPGGVARLFEPVARPVAVLLLLVVLAGVFLLVSGRLDRRHPRLVGGPLDRRDEHLEFE